MNWLEVTVNTAPERLDGLCSKLEDLGVEGLVIDDAGEYAEFLENNRQYWDYIDEALQEAIRDVCRVKFYLEDSAAGTAALEQITAALPGEAVSATQVRDEDWENNWKEFYKPMAVGERLLIVPEWETAPVGDRAVLRLDPGLIFGTGAHATTQMCLRALERRAAGAAVLDLGCGSGILAIAALLLGAESAVGCDIDPKAPHVAMENAAMNGLKDDRFVVYAGDVLSDVSLKKKLNARKYDLVLANIVADVILALAPLAADWLAPGGTFICSGIIDGREDEVCAALEAGGLEICRGHAQDGWHCFECQPAKR